MSPEIDLTELDVRDSSLDDFALRILSKVILLEERRTQRKSGLRVFCRLDVSIYRKTESGEHCYFVNEITRTHGAGLFPQYDSNNIRNHLFTHISNTLHHISALSLYQNTFESY
jgi:hypothetical protein